MNRFTQGALAVSAGTALLLGGAGSFALWHDTVSINPGSFAAGSLKVVKDPGSQWLLSSDEGYRPVNVANFAMVPGDSAIYTASLTVTAEGDNLMAELSYEGGEVRGVADIAQSISVAPREASPSIRATGDRIHIDGPGTYKIDVTVALDWDPDSEVGQGAIVELADLKFDLKQVLTKS